ncbi:hypothetical protein SRB17_86700 [Streptomyces sp. RB17]|nr:hypothetical protein [Streptomyces sp. RB17]
MTRAGSSRTRFSRAPVSASTASTSASDGILRGVARPLADGQVGAGPGSTAPAAVSSTDTSECRRPRRSRGSDSVANLSAMSGSSRRRGEGDLVRQTVADWRHIEAPVVQGDCQVIPVNRSLVFFVTDHRHPVTP